MDTPDVAPRPRREIVAVVPARHRDPAPAVPGPVPRLRRRSIVNIALPSIRRDLDFWLQGLQWVPSGYLLTYGGFMLLGGRAADLLGRRRVLVAGLVVFAGSSLARRAWPRARAAVGARLAQGVGAAMMLAGRALDPHHDLPPSRDRNTALGVWGGVSGLGGAAGVLFGGFLTEGPGWRWVLFVNPHLRVVLVGAFLLLTRSGARTAGDFDVRGALLVTGGMLLLVFALVKAPEVGWGAARTIAELGGALVLLARLRRQRAAQPRTRWCRSRSCGSGGSPPPTRRS